MSERINKILTSYYCQLALTLCMEARELCMKGECEKASRICNFVSSLCFKNDFETCKKEELLCKQISEKCVQGKGTEGCKEAQELCTGARKICPKNNLIFGV